MAFRFFADSAFARALPPFAAPRRERACTCGFFPSAGFKTSPVASSTTRRAFCAKSARLPPLLARVGTPAVWHDLGGSAMLVPICARCGMGLYIMRDERGARVAL